ncbi:MAG: EamA family transporter, partial [Clostridia bacterium]|nr:EamA family transporter [Clostridia bacterium]
MEKIKLIISMVIVGTIGLFTTAVALPSSAIACARALLGSVFILFVMLVLRKRPDPSAIKRNLPVLLVSGCALGFNWVLLFEAYKHTTVAVATLCYYMAPIFVILVSPLVLRERLTLQKLCCTAGAVVGAVLISGVFSEG